MLQELNTTARHRHNRLQRWFCSHDMDLYIWFFNDEPVRFQLNYDKRGDEKLISWDHYQGIQHFRVDRNTTRAGCHEITPLLSSPPTALDMARLARDFLAASDAMEATLADFIYARLLACAPAPEHYGAGGKGRHTAPKTARWG